MRNINAVLDQARSTLAQIHQKLLTFGDMADQDQDAFADLVGLRDELVSLNADFGELSADAQQEAVHLS